MHLQIQNIRWFDLLFCNLFVYKKKKNMIARRPVYFPSINVVVLYFLVCLVATFNFNQIIDHTN